MDQVDSDDAICYMNFVLSFNKGGGDCSLVIFPLEQQNESDGVKKNTWMSAARKPK